MFVNATRQTPNIALDILNTYFVPIFSFFTLAQSFPTPMEEPKKVLRAQYMGSCEVKSASGMEVLNEAIQRLSVNPSDTWQSVTIAVAPSMISIAHSSVSFHIS